MWLEYEISISCPLQRMDNERPLQTEINVLCTVNLQIFY